MTTATAPQPAAVAVRDEPTLSTFQVIERVIAAGDLAGMKPQERVDFYWRTCESLGLNPLTRPFEFINLNGKLTMYARKDATDQLRRINRVTVTDIRRDKDDALGLVTVYATVRAGDGREDESTGVVNIKGLSGEALANALMKAETKAKRRATLSLVGLGFLDESEIDGAERVDVDPTTGEITARAKPASLLDAVKAQQAAMAQPAAPDSPTSDDADSAEIEGESREVASAFDDAPSAVTVELADLLKRAVAEQPEVDQGTAASKEAIAAAKAGPLAGLSAGEDGEINAGIAAVFGVAATKHPSVAIVTALGLVADSIGQDAFTADWKASWPGSDE